MLIMLVLFLGGVLFGITQANQGMVETRGYEKADAEDVVNSSVEENGAYQIEVMGQDFEQLNLEKKQETYETVQTGHLTQKVAGGLETGVKWFYNGVIEGAYQFVQAFF